MDFAMEKQAFVDQVDLIFNKIATNLDKMSENIEQRIQNATALFDQKVKDKMIDINWVQNEVTAIQQTIEK